MRAKSRSLLSNFFLHDNHVASDLRNNTLVGTVPKQVGAMTKMRYLFVVVDVLPWLTSVFSRSNNRYLTFNMISGSIPQQLSQLTDLVDLYDRVVPDFWFTFLAHRQLEQNRFVGELPFNLDKIVSWYVVSSFCCRV